MAPPVPPLKTAKGKSFATRGAALKVQLEVCLGKVGTHLGQLIYAKDGAREFSHFAYELSWLQSTNGFNISPELAWLEGYQLRKAPSQFDPCFFLAMADTEPDAWGRRVIARAHAKARKLNHNLGALTELDYLCAVDDFSRMGALRLRDTEGKFLRSTDKGQRTPPVLLELESVMSAARAVELSRESAQDLQFLMGKATSLGGMRPKCSLLEPDGWLALGKFPSVTDERDVTRAEVLALRLAALAGIDAARARVVLVQGEPVAVIRRFDRTADEGRIPYLSGASFLQASRNDEHSYTEIVDVMRAHCEDFTASAQQLWRRLAFNLLITNVDDHLHNIGFLYAGQGRWKLSPAFDVNPFPDKDRESKTWLSEDSGPITSISELMAQAARFELPPAQALAVLNEVVGAVKQWRTLALTPDIGLAAKDLEEFAPAFEHAELERAVALLR